MIEQYLNYGDIKIESPYEIISLNECEIVAEVNEHTKLKFTGIISDDKKDSYIQSSKYNDKIQVLHYKNGKLIQILFSGQPCKIEVNCVNNCYYLTVEALSYTYNLDIEKRKRSFQREDMMYKDIMYCVIKNYDKAYFTDNASMDKNIENFILQYEETDWEFLKRLSSHFGSVLVSQSIADVPAFWFGLPKGKSINIKKNEYTIIKNVNPYRITTENYKSDMFESDYTEFEIESNIYMFTGDNVIINDVETKVYKSVFKMKDGILKMRYTLKRAEGIRQNLIKNKKIKGMSIEGKVIDRASNMIKLSLKIDIDSKNESCGIRWFKYESSYTYGNTNGLYFMPEINHFVNLYFPTESEKDAYSISSIRNNGNELSKTQNPDIKIIGTHHYKELKMSKEEIKITSKDTKEGKMYLQMTEKDGIKVESDKNIDICSSENINILGNTIKIHSDESISFLNSGGRTVLDGGILLSNSGIDILAKKDKDIFLNVKKGILNKSENAIKKIGLYGSNRGFDCDGSDPVSFSTGNCYINQNDIIINGVKKFAFTRFYNSLDNFKGIIGKNWHHNFDLKLKIEDKKITVIYNDGRQEDFDIFDDGKILSEYRTREIIKDKNGYKLKSYDKNEYYFDLTGKLISVFNIKTGKILLNYEKDLLMSIENKCGYIKLNYTNGMIHKITDMSGRSVEYTYTGDLLTCVKNINGGKTYYEYDSDGQVIKITDPRGVVQAKNVYDNKGRVIYQEIYESGRVFFKYDDKNKITTYTEKDDSEIIYKRNEYDFITEIQYPDGIEKKEFNTIGDIISYTDKNENTYEYKDGSSYITVNPLGEEKSITYDKNGNIIEEKNPDGSIKKYEYDSFGNIIAEVNELGIRIEYIYDERQNLLELKYSDGVSIKYQCDSKGNIITLVDGEGNETLFEYDSANRISQYIKPMGNETKYKYNELDKITEIIFADGTKIKKSYDMCGTIIEEIERNGGVTKYEYGKHGKITKKIDSNGAVTQYLYNDMWNISKIINPDGSDKLYKYNENNLLNIEIDEEGGKKQYWYDSNGNIIKEKNENGNITLYEYDGLNRITKIIDANNGQTTKEYRYDGKVIKVTDTLGGVLINNYDECGNLISEVNQEGLEIKYQYNERNILISKTDYYGKETKYKLNKNDKITEIIYPDETVEKLEYDKNSNIISFEEKEGTKTKYKYDCMDRIVTIIDALGGKKEITYNNLDKIESIKNENGFITKYEYDIKGNLIKVTDAKGNSIKYQYNIMGRLTSVLHNGEVEGQAKEIITSYKYNKKGFLTEETDAKEKITFYKYDKCGNLIEKEDRDGYITQYEYDVLNNLTKIDYGEGKTVKYEYDALSRVVSMKDWLGETSYELDIMGRIKKAQDFRGNTISYKYGLKGEKESITYYDGSVVKYRYDINGRIKNVISDKDITEYSYNPSGTVNEILYGNGQKTIYEYDLLNRITKLTNYGINNEQLDVKEIKYDSLGQKKNILSRTINKILGEGKKYSSDLITEYSYDEKGQLTKVKNALGYLEEFKYDSFGNRIKRVLEDAEIKITENYEYDELNRLIKIKDNKGKEKIFKYDNRGNLISIGNGKDIDKYIYDRTNKLIRAENKNKNIISFMYDGENRRLRKENKNGVYEYIIDYTDEYNKILGISNCGENESFIYGNNLVGSKRSREERNYYFHDEMESVIRITDTEGKNKRIFQYNAFGDMKDFGEKFDRERILLSFTGYEVEKDFSLMYAQARYYMPETGRFKEEDINKGNGFIPESLNYYSYCYNNPLLYIDLNGKEPKLVNYNNFDYEEKESNKNNIVKLSTKLDMLDPNSIKEKYYERETQRAVITFNQTYGENDNQIIERTLVFKNGENYVYEINKINNLQTKRIYLLNKPLELLSGFFYASQDDLDYIFSCYKLNTRSDYSRTTIIQKTQDNVTKLYFNKCGNPIIYIDNPEGLSKTTFNGDFGSRCFFECNLLDNKIYTVEYYSSASWSKVDGGIVCIALYPPQGQNASVTIKKIAYGDTQELILGNKKSSYGAEDEDEYKELKDSLQNYKSAMASKVQKKFMNYNKSMKIDIEDNQAALLVYAKLKKLINLRYLDLTTGLEFKNEAIFNLINGKVQFYTNTLVNLRICFLKQFTDFGSDIFSKDLIENYNCTQVSFNYIDIPKIKRFENVEYPQKDGSLALPNQTTAFMNYDTRKTNIFLDDKEVNFYLCNIGSDKRSNGVHYNELTTEYEILNEIEMNKLHDSRGFEKPRNSGRFIHLGNYSIIYEIQLVGKISNRKLQIFPWLNSSGTASILLNCNEDDKWVNYYFSKSGLENPGDDIEKIEEDYLSVDIPKNGLIKFLLPGANDGDIKFKIL